MKKRAKSKTVAAVVGELGHLAVLPRSDFYKVGVNEPINIGTLMCIAAQFAFLIAESEGKDGTKAATMALFSMLPSARMPIHDYLMWVAVDHRKMRRDILERQFSGMPEAISRSLEEIIRPYELREEPEARFAYEGYRLSSAYFDAIYQMRGNRTRGAWISNAKSIVKSRLGKEILSAIENGTFLAWWEDKIP